jgi:hypothetical protein
LSFISIGEVISQGKIGLLQDQTGGAGGCFTGVGTWSLENSTGVSTGTSLDNSTGDAANLALDSSTGALFLEILTDLSFNNMSAFLSLDIAARNSLRGYVGEYLF